MSVYLIISISVKTLTKSDKEWKLMSSTRVIGLVIEIYYFWPRYPQWHIHICRYQLNTNLISAKILADIVILHCYPWKYISIGGRYGYTIVFVNTCYNTGSRLYFKICDNEQQTDQVIVLSAQVPNRCLTDV